MTATQPPLQRMRIVYAKGEALKYLSHLDLARTWERTFRRAGLELAYSQGFNPRPRFQLAAALPVGVIGQAELLDVWLAQPLPAAEVLARLRPALPPGLEALEAAPVEFSAPSLQSQMSAADYQVLLTGDEPLESIRRRAQALLDAPTLPRRRPHKGAWQSYDLRPLIQALEVAEGPQGTVALTMRLQASPQGAGRPEEVLDALGLRQDARRIVRTRLISLR